MRSQLESLRVGVAAVPERRPGAQPRPTLRPWAAATPRPAGGLHLQIGGPLPADWSLCLARALARRGASLHTGYARRGPDGAWLAELAIEAEPHPTAEELLVYATRPEAPLARPDPRILDFDLGESPAHGGSLALEVHAWDAVGLLAGVLGRARAHDLVPAELILETEQDCAFHHLALTGTDAAPSRRQRRALSLGLAGLLGGR